MKNSLAIAGAIIAMLAIVIGVSAVFAEADIRFTEVFGTRKENAKTDVVRQSNQYVASQQQRLLDLLNEYNRSATSPEQKAVIVVQMHDTASKLDNDRVPDEVARFLTTHPRGSK